MMIHSVPPAIWLIVLIVGLPQLSETVYTPSLPDIAHTLRTREAIVEYTLTIYLFGFALGTLFWGKVSDTLGRKPCVIAGLLLFVMGCIGCYVAPSIEVLMISRLIQAFGGSVGSVLGQAICRDVFHGPALGQAYASIAGALALFPALGPLCGGLIADILGWRSIFLFLVACALIIIILVRIGLPETHPQATRQQVSLRTIAMRLICDRTVLGFGLIVAGCNGILFSYFAEGSFYLIKGLGLSPSHYGLSFTAIGGSAMLGGIMAKRWLKHHTAQDIMGYGLWIIALATIFFSCIATIHHTLYALPAHIMIAVTLMAQMTCTFGISMASVNALALALVDYKHAIGTASSLFGFFYYSVISALTFVMGYLHNGTLLPMPLYFFTLSVLMLLVRRCLCHHPKTHPVA
jgi:DHA1 family bicyclomycin/chloramphenicol resistance-like MFS transporter